MGMSLLHKSCKAVWGLVGVVLIVFLLSGAVICDVTSAGDSDDATSTEAMRKAYRASHFPWAAIENPEMVAELIKNGEDVNATDEDGVTALHWAVYHDKFGIVKLLLENGADVNVKEHSKGCGFCGWGWYPLHLALRNENRDIIKMLIDHGADVNAKRTDAWTPLHTAAYHGQPDVIELLISKGANANVYDGEPLVIAIEQGKLDGAKVMLKHGAHPDARRDVDRGGKGETALIVAVYCNNISSAKLLLDNKANPNIADNSGKTPLFHAAHAGHLAMMKLLVSKGADVNAQAKDGTSIMEAVIEGKQAFLASDYKKEDLAKRDWYGVKRVLLRHGAKE